MLRCDTIREFDGLIDVFGHHGESLAHRLTGNGCGREYCELRKRKICVLRGTSVMAVAIQKPKHHLFLELIVHFLYQCFIRYDKDGTRIDVMLCLGQQVCSNHLKTEAGRVSASMHEHSICSKHGQASRTSGFAVWSAMTRTSEGPASMSMAQMPDTSDLAAVTHRLPGPTITSQGSTAPTPYAMAPIACPKARSMDEWMNGWLLVSRKGSAGADTPNPFG